ncbi:MAG: divergent polysaccharide deacetylase family protein [Syntrophobacterales bacterium]|nr:divergent polysaccharide deacetylase family protein [Syntrophobacterales bacterium]
MAKIFRREKKEAKGFSKSPILRRWFFRLWSFVALIWIGLLFWVYWSSREGNIKVTETKIGLSEKTGLEKVKESLSLTTKSYQDNNKEKTLLNDGPNRQSSGDLKNRIVSQGRISIIIDDMGGSLDIARKFLELPYPMAFAVLPYESYSREVAKMIRKNGRVLLLHMPMEPHEYPDKNPGKGALLLSQSRETQRKLFMKALEQVPGAVGVNNHMGSRFTENRDSMRFFMEILKERNLFFVDSVTTDKTVACDVAKDVGVKCFRRNVFLDHEPTVTFVNTQLVRLIDIAKERGDVTIAIGHPHRVTLDTLKRGLKDIQSGNIELVSINEIKSTSR